MSSKGTFLYPAIVDRLNQSQTPADVYTKTESDARYAKLGNANIFDGQNTFNQRITSYKGFQTSNTKADILSMNYNQEKKSNIVYKQTTTGYKNWCHMQYLWTANDSNYTNLMSFVFKPDTSVNEVEITSDLGSFTVTKPVNFKDKIEMKDPNNHNGAFLDNFDYSGENLTSLKFNKNNTRAMLVVEVNNNTEKATISTPNQTSGLSIKNLSNPTDNNDAVNKAYVDSRTTTYYQQVTVANGVDRILTTIDWNKHIIGVVVFRKRTSDNKWFCIKNDMNQQLYREDSTGQFKLYGSDSNGFTNDYRVYITYIN